MATATFSEQGHAYEQDGVAIPSVTQILTLAGISDVSGVPAHILDRARSIGTAVHQASELLDEGDLDFETLDPQIVGYVEGYRLFREKESFQSEHVEQRGIGQYASLRFGFCVDRIGVVANRNQGLEGTERRVLLDIKTSSRPQISWAIQTAAYAMGTSHDDERLVVHLAKDGSYKLLWHEEDNDFKVWAAALEIAHWKLAHGVKIKER